MYYVKQTVTHDRIISAFQSPAQRAQMNVTHFLDVVEIFGLLGEFFGFLDDFFGISQIRSTVFLQSS